MITKCPKCGKPFCSAVEPTKGGMFVHRWCPSKECNWHDVEFVEEVSNEDAEAKD